MSFYVIFFIRLVYDVVFRMGYVINGGGLLNLFGFNVLSSDCGFVYGGVDLFILGIDCEEFCILFDMVFMFFFGYKCYLSVLFFVVFVMFLVLSGGRFKCKMIILFLLF